MSGVSFLIPARNEIYLEKTIWNILENIRGDSEIIVVLDGYLPDPQIVLNDKRVIFIHYKESIGQRKAINAAAKRSTKPYICKLDAHCAIDEGFDVKMIADCEYDWTVIPRMYNLDVKTWLPKKHKVTDYMYMGLRDNGEMRSEYYTGKEYKKQHSKTELIDDVMGCMGPCFFMNKDRFWELGGCDEGHEGGWGQQGIEVACKAWLSGGSMKVNKKTWFSHWFRGDVGFPYPMSGKQVARVRAYSKDLWLNNKWPQQTRKFEWLLEKFNPPGWKQPVPVEDRIEQPEYAVDYHKSFRKPPVESSWTWAWPTWKKIPIVKYPQDLFFYQQILWNHKPDFLIETGTQNGGSATFFADIMDLIGNGHVITIDIKPILFPSHKRITTLIGRSTGADIIEKVRSLIPPGKSVMVSLDSDHSRVHVKRELYFYAPMVTQGQYLVVEDCYPQGDSGQSAGTLEAVDWFMAKRGKFNRVIQNDMLTLNTWLQRK